MIHLFEPIGKGGIYQHTCAVAGLLSDLGEPVVIHTARAPEAVAPHGVRVCQCSWWPRDGRPAPPTALASVIKILTCTIPHLHRSVGPGDVVHIEGAAAGSAFASLVLGVGRLRRGRRVVFSPHNVFSRHGRIDALVLRVALRLAHAVLVHSEADVDALRRHGVAARYVPLAQPIAVPTGEQRRAWRDRWRAGPDTEVVLLAGNLRSDKRLDLLVEAASGWAPTRVLAVVGKDKGAWPDAVDLAARRGVRLVGHPEYVALEEFCAAIAAADVVVAPYRIASQSGVLAIARQLGVPTVGSDVGGLHELASQTFTSGDVQSLRAAVDAVLALDRDESCAVGFDDDATAKGHLDAYRVTVGTGAMATTTSRTLAVAAKRVLDVVGSAALLVLLSPLLLAVAVAVRASSRGPAIFRQVRAGRGGRPFIVFKFRSMYQDVSSTAHLVFVQDQIQATADAPAASLFKLGGDRRITPIGRWLRRTSIDELPQLMNVFAGSMSLVGPRPPLAYELALHDADDMRRLDVKPGITGLWQVSGRARLDYRSMIDLDIRYVENWSLREDFRILARTLSAVLRMETR